MCPDDYIQSGGIDRDTGRGCCKTDDGSDEDGVRVHMISTIQNDVLCKENYQHGTDEKGRSVCRKA